MDDNFRQNTNKSIDYFSSKIAEIINEETETIKEKIKKSGELDQSDIFSAFSKISNIVMQKSVQLMKEINQYISESEMRNKKKEKGFSFFP